MRFVYVSWWHTFLFFDILKSFEFHQQLFFERKRNCEFWGLKIEKWHNSEIAILQNVQFYAIWRFSIASYFKTEHYSNLLTFAVFWPKMAKRDVTKTPFSQKISPDFFLKFWWQTSNWWWGRYWKFRVDICRRFWAIEKIRRGEAEYATPLAPSGARVKY